MKQTVIVVLLGWVLGAAALAADTAESQAAESESKSSEAAEAADGKAEETVRTPFGYVKKRKVEKPAEPPKPSKPLVDVRVVGDKVTFQRKTPFGMQSWTRSRNELSDDERKLAEQAGVDVSDGSSHAVKPKAPAAKEAEQTRP